MSGGLSQSKRFLAKNKKPFAKIGSQAVLH
jgi:hypothetical protein